MALFAGFLLPLPQADDLRSSKEMAFFENIRPCLDESLFFDKDLTVLTENYKRKPFFMHREYTGTKNENESSFLSLLQYLSKIQVLEGDVLVIVGGTWNYRQLRLINELYPGLEFNLWSCKVSDLGFDARLSFNVEKKYGFPTKDTYSDSSRVHVFSEFRSNQSSNILKDLETQMAVVEACGPLTASVRFRPPFCKNSDVREITYFDGEVTTIPYSCPSGTAVRIFLERTPDGQFKKANYDVFEFDQILNHYNTEVRSLRVWQYKEKRMSFDDCYKAAIIDEIQKNHSFEKLWNDISNACSFRGTITPKL